MIGYGKERLKFCNCSRDRWSRTFVNRGQRPRLQVNGWINDFVAAIDDRGMRKPRPPKRFGILAKDMPGEK
jgi:hypothetical protein